MGPVMDKALFPLLLEEFQLEGKPVLVFCPTRKSKLSYILRHADDVQCVR